MPNYTGNVICFCIFFFQAEDGIRDAQESRGLGDVYKRQDQKVRNDWYLEIEDHQKNLHKVLLAPGEMIFYESATLKHGRPEPLSGEYYSNIFCHYMTKMVS